MRLYNDDYTFDLTFSGISTVDELEAAMDNADELKLADRERLVIVRRTDRFPESDQYGRRLRRRRRSGSQGCHEKALP